MYNQSQFQKRSIDNILRNTDKLQRYLNTASPRMVPKGVVLPYPDINWSRGQLSVRCSAFYTFTPSEAID